MTFILEVLKMLQDNNYNWKETEAMTKVHRITLKKWRKQYANVMYPDNNVKTLSPEAATTRIVDNLIEEQIPEGKISFSDLADGLRVKMLNRIEELVKDTKDVEKIARSMKIVHDIKRELDDGTGNNERGIPVRKPGNNFIQIITEQIKLMQNEPDID